MVASHHAGGGLHARRKGHTIEDEQDILHNNLAALDIESSSLSPTSGNFFKYHKASGPRSSAELRWALTAVGAFLSCGLLLAFFLLHHQHHKVILKVVWNDPGSHVGHLFNKGGGRAGFRHHFYSGHPKFVTVVLPSVVRPDRRPQRLQAIQDTWGPYARAIFVVHNTTEFPPAVAAHAVLSEDSAPQDRFAYPQVLQLPEDIEVNEGLPRLYHTVRAIHEKVDPDFAFFVNDHTFVIPEHLCKFLEPLNSEADLYAGHALKNGRSKDEMFNSGAAGYLLSRATMRKIIAQWDAKDPSCWFDKENTSQWIQGNPGLATVKCLSSLNIHAIDTRAKHKWHRFHAFPLTRMVTGALDDWYKNKHVGVSTMLGLEDESYDTVLKGLDCCSMDTVSFHYVEAAENLALFATREFLLTNPAVSDRELKEFMLKEWPSKREDIGGYSRGLPNKDKDDEGWKELMAVLRKMSTRKTQQEC